MSILNLFGIKKDTKPADVVRNVPEYENKIEKTNKSLQDILNENPDLINNLNTNEPTITTGGISEIQPKAFTTINNLYNTLTEPRFGKLGIMDLVSTGKFMANPTILNAAFSPIGFLALGALQGLGGLGGRLTGIRGGVDLRGDTTFDTFRRSTSFADFFQRQRDKKAREAAARRGELKQLQERIDKGDFGGPKNGGSGFQGEGGYGSSAERGGALHG